MKNKYQASFLGTKTLNKISISELLPFLNKMALFRISWGALKAKGERWLQIQKEFRERLDKMLNLLEQDCWIQPQACYGHWLASSTKDSITLFSEDKVDRPIAEFIVPRQVDKDKLSLADYINSNANGEFDIVSLQVVTSGFEASTYIKDLFQSEMITEAYFAHGLAVQFAEATAEYVHQKIRKDLNLEPNQGKRYSWGYDPIPDLSQHKIVFELLKVKQEIGMGLTSAYQIIPEQSTAALVIHDKAAKYFQIEKK